MDYVRAERAGDADPEEEVDIEFVTSRACSSVSVFASRAPGMVEYEELREDGRYLHMSPEELTEVLSSNAISVPFEEDVYELLLDWVYYDFEHRKQYFGMVFGALRLPFVPNSYIQSVIKREELVRNSPVAYGVVCQHEQLQARVKGRRGGTPRDNFSEHGILVCGGKASETLSEVYYPSTNSWEILAAMPVGRSNAGVFRLTGGVCFVGGEDRHKTVMSHPVRLEDGGSWGEGVVVPGQSRTGARCATLNGRTYLMGGISPDEGYTPSVERFNPANKRWVPVKSMESARFSFGCTELDGFVYVCGGFDGEKDLRQSEFFMPDANEWTMIAPMNVARSGCQTVAAEGKLYTLGGWNGSEIVSSCEVYDPRSNRWSMIEPMNRPRHGLEVVVIGNVIYAIGGWNGKKQQSSVERYHTRAGVWEPVAPMSVGRWLTTAISIPVEGAGGDANND